MIAPFRVPRPVFAALSAGGGGSPGVQLLLSAQVSRRMQLIRMIADGAADPAALRPALGVLSAAQRAAPTTVTEILGDPWIGAWASRAVRHLRGTVSSQGRPLTADLEQLNAVAVVAAAAAGVDADLPVPILDGQVVLPTLGTTRERSLPPGRLAARVRNHTVTVDGRPVTDASPLGWWLPPGRLATIDGATVVLTDRDPYRDCFRMTVESELPPARRQRWQRWFGEAWELLTAYLPHRREELGSGLKSLVPLSAVEGDAGLSATSHDAFGALALTEPYDAAGLAATLVHEFQHSKLSALNDLVPLYDPASGERHFAPWRADPRPIGGLLQGVYAFAAVAETWLALRQAPGHQDRASAQFAELRAQLLEALPALRESPALTTAGRSFVAGLCDWLAPILAAPVGAAADAGARREVAAIRIRWRLRHRQPSPERVHDLITLYRAENGGTAGSAPAPDDLEGWVGILMAMRPAPAEPELLQAGYLRLLAEDGGPPDLAALGRLADTKLTAP